MLHLPEEWLRSNGLRNCPQDRPPSIVNTWSQFLCTRSMYFFCFFFEWKKCGLNCWREEKFLNRWNGGWFQCPSLLNFCWGQIFHTTWLHFIGNPHHINIIMDFGRIYFKPQKSSYSQKWCQSPWSKTHGDIISSRPIVRAHGTTSHFWLMIQAHESHRGNFGSRGLEGQEACSVKL